MNESLIADVSVVIATRDRRDALCRTLDRLTGLRGSPPVIVVDNGSRDGTADTVRRLYPGVDVIALRGNRGAAGRNAGVRRAPSRYVAFSDDDSWWDPPALERAAALLDAHPEVGAVVGRTLVGPDWREDPLNEVLARSALPAAGLPGPRVLGFLGCAVVMRRDAFLDAGGYRPLLCAGGEEELLALDLAARGWACVYAPSVVARRVPSEHREVPGQAALRRNKVLIAVLRRPLGRVVRLTAGLAMDAIVDTDARRALAGLLPRLPLAILERRPVPRSVTAMDPRDGAAGYGAAG